MSQASPEGADPRFTSGVPGDHRPDAAAFLVLAGFSPPPAASEAPQAPVISVNLESENTFPRPSIQDRLLEAEQLLHDLENQPRDIP